MRWERVHVNARARETPEGKKSAGRKGGIWGPGKRWGHTCNAIKGGRYLYVFGGYSKDNCQTNEVHVFDTVKQTWSKPMMKGVPPSARDSHTCTTVGNSLFVFGGTDGKNPLKDLHVLDTSSNTWTLPCIHGKGPDAREGHSAALVDKRLFIFGGCGKFQDNPKEIYYDDLYILDTEKYVWERAVTSGTPPSARDSHTYSSWKNKLIVLGGEDSSDYYLSDVHVLDTDTLVWKELNTAGQMLAPRAGHSAVALGGNLFVFGGFTDHRSLYDDLHVLNMDTGIWSKVTNVNQGPSARFSAAGDCVDPQNGILVFIGGCNGSLEALDDMYYLHTDMGIENGKVEGRQEKLSFRKELKKKCQESRFENDNDVYKLGMMSDSCQAGTSTCDSMSAEGKMFQARVTNAFSNWYTIETNIDGSMLHGVLFSCNSNFAHDSPAYINKKRMGMDGSANLNDGFQPRFKTAKRTHRTTKSTDQGKIDHVHAKRSTALESHGETLILNSTNLVPAGDVNQSHMGSENLEPSSEPQVDLKSESPDCPPKPIKEDTCENTSTVAEDILSMLPNEGRTQH